VDNHNKYTNSNNNENSKNNTSLINNSPPIVEIGQNLPNNIILTKEQQEQLEKLRQEVFKDVK
jgi:hypothetical protein